LGQFSGVLHLWACGYQIKSYTAEDAEEDAEFAEEGAGEDSFLGCSSLSMRLPNQKLYRRGR